MESQRGHGGDLVRHGVDRAVEVSLGGHTGVCGGRGDRLRRHGVVGAVVVVMIIIVVVVAGVENDPGGGGRGSSGGSTGGRDGVSAGAGADVA